MRRRGPEGVTCRRGRETCVSGVEIVGRFRVQNAVFRHVEVASPAQNALFRESDTPRVRFSVSRRVQTALLREIVCAECVFA